MIICGKKIKRLLGEKKNRKKKIPNTENAICIYICSIRHKTNPNDETISSLTSR